MIRQLFGKLAIMGTAILLAIMPIFSFAQVSNGAAKVQLPNDKYKNYVDERKLNVYRSYGFRDWYFGLNLGYLIAPSEKYTIQNRAINTKANNGFALDFNGGFHISRFFSMGLSVDVARFSSVAYIGTEKIGDIDGQSMNFTPVLTFWPIGNDQKIYLPFVGIGLGQNFTKKTYSPKIGTPVKAEDIGESGTVLKLNWGIDFSLDPAIRVGVRHEHQFLDFLKQNNKQVDIFGISGTADF